ncbi:sigma-70 family RNA polymerase sigma factor [Actinocatenispora rupis]|uniref:RNA polymerase sigma-70 region 4 domain-containing protein n=1 Tax=Actinocatenispora rupis TaxID=519421 RepID=A0A8J3J5L6_9ACTN|nr:sigma-70 family RNA polymerase sigma factor [Actinocatenispora rupis]GID12392.1 hypothetical protein Aru02nite_32810 [Actinocatenispora rupis]
MGDPAAARSTGAPVADAGGREQLSQRLHRSAGVADLAAVLGVGTAEITETLLAEQNYRPMSLNAPTNRDDDGRPPRSLEEVVGSIDRDLDAVAARVSLPAALTRLPERDRTVLALRFVADLSQTEIGRRLGISQMHVSRIIASALAQLRAYLDGDDPVPAIRPRYGQRPPNDGRPGAYASGCPLPAAPHRGTADAGAVPTRDTGNAVAAGGGR